MLLSQQHSREVSSRRICTAKRPSAHFQKRRSYYGTDEEHCDSGNTGCQPELQIYGFRHALRGQGKAAWTVRPGYHRVHPGWDPEGVSGEEPGGGEEDEYI